MEDMATPTVPDSRGLDLNACEKFYGLLARPFSLTPDLRFAYHSRSHSRALAQVREALRRRDGLIVITGEIGIGKTMLCRTLLETFEARTFLSVILDPCLSVDDLLRQVLADFGLMGDADRPRTGPAPEVTRHQLVSALQRFLASLIALDAHAVILIDEAQHLQPSVLEEIRLLTNFETDGGKLLQIVLVGQPDLDALLRRPELIQLNQRIARRFELHALSQTEVQDYITHRLAVASEAEAAPGAGAGLPPKLPAAFDRVGRVVFTPPAIAAVAAISKGIPRVINTLCDRALEVGCQRQTLALDRTVVLKAAEQLKLPVPIALKLPGGVQAAAAAASLVLVVVAGLWWWWPHRIEGAATQTATAGRTPTATATSSVQAAAPPSVPATTASGVPATAAPPGGPAASPPGPSRATPTAPPGAQAPAPPRVVATAPSGTPAPPADRVAPRAGAPVARPAQTGPDQSGVRYTIAVAAFKTPQRAADVAATIAGKGLRVSTRTDPAGAWHQIVVGPYGSVDEAKAVQRTLALAGFQDTHISPSIPVSR
jgi:general secretion pathway protein A